MSDYQNTNIHRAGGTSGRGLLIAFGLIVGIVALLAIVGTFGGGGEIAGGETAITPPAAESPVAPSE